VLESMLETYQTSLGMDGRWFEVHTERGGRPRAGRRRRGIGVKPARDIKDA